MKSILLMIAGLSLGFFFLLDDSTLQHSKRPAGNGSKTNPYQIATLENLYWLSQNSRYWDKHFKQTANIDASLTAEWDDKSGFSPIGNFTTPFTGTYDGDGHTIDGLTINGLTTRNVGLFGYTTDAMVKNLGLTNVSVTGCVQPGNVVGYNDESFVTNCYSMDRMVEGDSSLRDHRQAEY